MKQKVTNSNRKRQAKRKAAAAFKKQLSALRARATKLRQQRPQLPKEARGHASNIIEQIGNVKTAADFERLKPFMAASLELLRDCSQ